MFTGWQTFYQLTGSAAGALVGLLFIVATLTSRTESGVATGVKLYMTPTVFQLSLVIVESALALAPQTELYSAAMLMTVCAVVGCANSIWVAVRIATQQSRAHWSDFWCYGALPLAADLALAAATAAAWLETPHAAYAVGLALLVLLMAAIRNAWDLVTWLAPRRPG
jgi:crotonobetainyl-CoA:carnitine CoA-transferase CaiB-like acyl-CoA transferase